MTHYIHTETLGTFAMVEIRRLHPQVSIPDGADLAGLGYAPLQITMAPDAPAWHTAEPGTPEQVQGAWRTTWAVREMTAQEKSDHAAQQIRQIEAESGIVRILREATILQLESWAAAQGYPLAAFRAANKGYRLLKETDEHIATLREYIL